MIAVAIVCTTSIKAQEPDMVYHVVLGVVDGLRTTEQARQLNDMLSKQAGVIMARVDYNTRNLMIQVAASNTLHEEQLRGWIEAKGFSLRCYSRAAASAGPYHALDARYCGVPPTDR